MRWAQPINRIRLGDMSIVSYTLSKRKIVKKWLYFFILLASVEKKELQWCTGMFGLNVCIYTVGPGRDLLLFL